MLSQGKVRWAIVSTALLLPLVLSLFSGYRSAGLPPEVFWDITPLGLLTGIRPEFFSFGTSCDFEGLFSFSLDYFRVFLKTNVLELLFYFLALKPCTKSDAIFYCLLGNVLTHPFIFFFFQCLVSSFLVFLFGAECIAAMGETVLISAYLRRNRKPIKPAFWVAIGNLFSWQVGPFLF